MIREYSKSDTKDILELGKLLHDTYKISDYYDFDKIYVYEHNNRIVAFIEFRLLYESIELLNLVVDKEYRRQGIADKLIKKLFEFDCKSIILEVSELNIAAINLYKKNDFKVIRKIKNYYNDSNALVMERKLL